MSRSSQSGDGSYRPDVAKIVGELFQEGTQDEPLQVPAESQVVIDPPRRRVSVYKGGRALRVFRAVVGKPSTPTPPGEFFVEESIALPAEAVGAPYALALSARSNVLQEFAGGPGQIALHGLDNIGGIPGTAVSHGCVRLATQALHWLVFRIGPGVPVTITS